MDKKYDWQRILRTHTDPYDILDNTPNENDEPSGVNGSAKRVDTDDTSRKEEIRPGSDPED